MKTVQNYSVIRERHVIEVIRAFGGPDNIARILGVTRDNVYKWRNHIPADCALRLYRHAQKKGLKNVTLEMLRPDIFPPPNPNIVNTPAPAIK